jgi:hypothetical protein
MWIKMNMELWNFLERISKMKKAIVYFENYRDEYDQNMKIGGYYLQINVDDCESEIIETSYIIEAKTKKELQKIVEYFKKEYFQAENIKEIIEDW